MPKIKGTRKFGKKRYVLKWDSKTFNAPDTKASVQEKLRIAKLYLADYKSEGYFVRLTRYNNNKDVKVYVLGK